MLKQVKHNKRIVYPSDAQVPSYNCKDIIEKLVVYNPNERITLEKLKQHPFMLVDELEPSSAPTQVKQIHETITHLPEEVKRAATVHE